MLTVIDIINRVLGYFNIADKPKGKAFTWVAFFANFYLLYVAIENLRYPDFRIRGALFLLAFVVFLYFIALNFLYYFTNKTTRFDISPTVEKWLGSNGAKKTAVENELKTQLGAAPANGVFSQEQLLTADVTLTDDQQANLDALVASLVKQGVLSLNYQGLDDKAIERVAQETQKPVLAIGAPYPLPFFDLQHVNDQLIITGGLNALTAKPIATVERVGLLPVEKAAQDYHLVAANVFLIGGEQKLLGRSGLRKESQPYSLTVQLAYQDKSPAASQEKVDTDTHPVAGRQPEAPQETREGRHALDDDATTKLEQQASEQFPTRESRRHQK
ncbi:hypothetical protein FD51_GL001246 [Lacticaseibacillus zeae DSM 20178 = KCTC 3804]|uniref:Uncharacterized protein n=2 Tax=Lacticaseibacillus zeae TaxID=57037 RepID=A0A5R8LSP8_LACZE|nr:DUF6681 family protein [Lacticaseibacillus zeae]KRK11067.1 hypothetical protein FD51_GL001246 [Lacticaseibacillus zeae DSM 20178 = KCTC 3804]OLS10015.1 hypothetical protein AUQ39_04640 [Lacticaseibacillus casei]QVI31139.1 hypothetical protein KG087_09395 [Lacticaseibacillus zeae]TLF40261.1 hypothetical protein FEI14_10645 [Lacticaseibacillus zeae]